MPQPSPIIPSGIRVPPTLKNWLKQQASANCRSFNAEVVVRLQRSMDQQIKDEVCGLDNKGFAAQDSGHRTYG